MKQVYTTLGANGRSSPADLHRPKRVGETRHLTDLGNAERFVDDHRRYVRFCYAWGRWVIFDGKRWIIDDAGDVERLMKETVRRIYAEAAEAESEGDRKAIADHAKRSEARKRIVDALYLARSELAVSPDELDCHPYLLNCANGTIDLRTGELREHDRHDYITKLAPASFDLFAKAPAFDRFLEKILPSVELRNFVQTVFGYAAIGVNTEEILTILHGLGANGKSTLVNIIMEALGDYAMQAAPDLLLAKKGSHPTELADLFGARFVASSETDDGRRLNEGLVKQLTGRDRIKARRMKEDFWEFDPTHTLFLATNHRPEVRGTDYAIWRRLKLVPFDVRIPPEEQDKKLPEKLRAELPGILAWIVRGALVYQQRGLREPSEVKAATDGYRANMDVLAGFIEDRCVVRKGVRCEFSKLFAAWNEWCEEANETPGSKRKFGDRLTERGFEKGNGTNNVAIRWGIALRHDGDPDPSRINDPEPDRGAEGRDTPTPRSENVNSGDGELSIDNSQNPCKTETSNYRINDHYPENSMSGKSPLIWASYSNPVNDDSLVNSEPSVAEIGSTPRECPHGDHPEACVDCALEREGF